MKSYMKTILNAIMAWVESRFGTKAELNAKADKIDLETKVDKKTKEEILDILIKTVDLSPLSEDGKYLLEGENFLTM